MNVYIFRSDEKWTWHTFPNCMFFCRVLSTSCALRLCHARISDLIKPSFCYLIFQKHLRKIHFVIICWVESISRFQEKHAVFECLIIKHKFLPLICEREEAKTEDEEECFWVRKREKFVCEKQWTTMRRGKRLNEKWRNKSGFDDGFPRENFSQVKHSRRSDCSFNIIINWNPH